MWGSGTSCYSSCQKCHSTYLHDRGMKLDINDVCEMGIVFSNNAFCMDIVTHMSCMYTLTTVCGIPIMYRQFTVLYLG
jgi:hypothetical protein